MTSFKGTPDFKHSSPDRIGVLLTNLGSPEAPEPKALKTYLKEFLSDPRVVEVPRVIWWLVLNGIILNTRPKKSAAAYKEVWTEDGSPLLIHTRNQASKLQGIITQTYGDNVIVEMAMRYGQPAIQTGIERLLQKGARKVLVLPLYPQYSAATTASTFDAIAQDFKSRRWLPEFRFISHYHDHPLYIKALADSIRDYQQQYGQPDKLILSYHGIPESYHLNGDPYFCECHKTTRLVAESLGLQKDQFMTTFQSRFGKQEWIKPYTDMTLKSLPAQGVKNVQVICPGFSSDCLETIEEIGQENMEYFIESGGESFGYIPALNDSQNHIELMANLVDQHLQGWIIQPENLERRQKLAMELGARF